MLLVFGIFVAPAGLSQGNLLDLGGSQVCLVGLCGINIWFGVGLLGLFGIALFGPGLNGIVFKSHQPSER